MCHIHHWDICQSSKLRNVVEWKNMGDVMGTGNTGNVMGMGEHGECVEMVIMGS